MKRDYTMEDFRAEMRRRGVNAATRSRATTQMNAETRSRATTRAKVQLIEVCTTCGGTKFIDAIDNHGQSYRGCKQCRIDAIEHSNGNMIIEVVPCGVHPLHAVKVRANGARSGCPMCATQITDICRSFAVKRAHAPRITLDRTRIVGCTCGWRTPPGTTDSDDAFAMHVAIARAGGSA